MVKQKNYKVATEAFVGKAIFDLEQRIEESFEELERELAKKDKRDEERYNKVMEHLVDLIGKFQKFDEEGVIAAGRLRNHEDRIEKLEGVVLKTS